MWSNSRQVFTWTVNHVMHTTIVRGARDGGGAELTNVGRASSYLHSTFRMFAFEHSNCYRYLNSHSIIGINRISRRCRGWAERHNCTDSPLAALTISILRNVLDSLTNRISKWAVHRQHPLHILVTFNRFIRTKLLSIWNFNTKFSSDFHQKELILHFNTLFDTISRCLTESPPIEFSQEEDFLFGWFFILWKILLPLITHPTINRLKQLPKRKRQREYSSNETGCMHMCENHKRPKWTEFTTRLNIYYKNISNYFNQIINISRCFLCEELSVGRMKATVCVWVDECQHQKRIVLLDVTLVVAQYSSGSATENASVLCQ